MLVRRSQRLYLWGALLGSLLVLGSLADAAPPDARKATKRTKPAARKATKRKMPTSRKATKRTKPVARKAAKRDAPGFFVSPDSTLTFVPSGGEKVVVLGKVEGNTIIWKHKTLSIGSGSKGAKSGFSSSPYDSSSNLDLYTLQDPRFENKNDLMTVQGSLTLQPEVLVTRIGNYGVPPKNAHLAKKRWSQASIAFIHGL